MASTFQLTDTDMLFTQIHLEKVNYLAVRHWIQACSAPSISRCGTKQVDQET